MPPRKTPPAPEYVSPGTGGDLTVKLSVGPASLSLIRIEAAEETYRQALRSGFAFRRALRREATATTLHIVVQDTPSGNVGSLAVPPAALKSL